MPDNISKDISKYNDIIAMLVVLERIDDDTHSLPILRDIVIAVPTYQFLLKHHNELHHHKRRYAVRCLKKTNRK